MSLILYRQLQFEYNLLHISRNRFLSTQGDWRAMKYSIRHIHVWSLLPTNRPRVTSKALSQKNYVLDDLPWRRPSISDFADNETKNQSNSNLLHITWRIPTKGPSLHSPESPSVTATSIEPWRHVAICSRSTVRFPSMPFRLCGWSVFTLRPSE